MTHLATLWDAAREAAEARDAALLQVQANAPAWSVVAYDVLREIAGTHRTLSSEDLWKALDERHVPRPVEGRAIGPVLMRAVREGLLEGAGYARGTDPKHHRDILRTYRSLVVR